VNCLVGFYQNQLTMKHLLVLTFFVVINLGLCAQASHDTVLIQATVVNYIEGWDYGDTARMAASLHPQLAKRGVVTSRTGKGLEILPATFQDMITWTSYQKKSTAVPSNHVIRIHELSENIASVSCISTKYIDYLHLVRTAQGWKIINAVWEPNKQKK
jgi:hypothetical protein